MRKKLVGENTKLLSLVGRISLTKAVLASTPIYAIQLAVIPKGVYSEMEKIVCKFEWRRKE